jgi:valyl-tRNA synthetase
VDAITEPLDVDLIAQLGTLIDETTKAFEQYDYARALERTEQFFWSFCDDYIELVKIRAYGEDNPAGLASARAALSVALSVLQRLFAPFLPFVTEEVWSWWHSGSVHVAAWPTRAELPSVTSPTAVYGPVCEVLTAVRREKTEAKVSMRAEIESLVVTNTAEFISAVQLGERDLCDAGAVRTVSYVESSDTKSVAVTFVPAL